jgi:outer membrane protein
MRNLVALAACLYFGVSAPRAQDLWDLRRCVEYAVANNISVKQADIDFRRAELGLQQSQLSQYPSLSLSSNGGINAGRSVDPTTNLFTQQQLLFSGFNMQTGVNLFNWFAVRNTIAANRYETDAASATAEKIRNDISLNVAVSYLQVLLSQEQVRIVEVAIQQTLQNMANTRKRVETGTLPELNLAEIEAQLSRDSSSLVTARATASQNLLGLKALLNLDAAVPFAIAMPPVDKIPVEPLEGLQPDIVYALALANLPQQRINELKIKAAGKAVEASKAQLFPALSLFGGIATNYANNDRASYTAKPTGVFKPSGALVNVGGTNYDVLAPEVKTLITTYKSPFSTQVSDNFRRNVGLSLNIPVFNSGNARIAWQRSKLNLKNAELLKEQGERTLKQDIYRAYNDAMASLQKFNASRKSVETAEKAYHFAEKRYEVGLLSTIDFLTNQNNLTRSKLEKALAEADYVFRLKYLEFYKGQGIKL